MNKDIVWGVVRAVLAAAGGYFVAKGLVDAGTLETVLGAVGVLFTAGWSIWAKK